MVEILFVVSFTFIVNEVKCFMLLHVNIDVILFQNKLGHYRVLLC